MLKNSQRISNCWLLLLSFSLIELSGQSSQAQSLTFPQIQVPRPTQPLPPSPIPTPLPSPKDLVPLPPSLNLPEDKLPSNMQAIIKVKAFKFEGNTVFSQEELAQVTKDLLNRPLSFAELLQARSAITRYYQDAGYVTSGAYIPPQTIKKGLVTIKIIEGSVEKINVQVDGRLSPDYIRDRLALATQTPLNVPRLVEALQLLKLDPLVETISAELAAGIRPESSILDVTVRTAPSLSATIILDNGRAPSVGSFRRGVELKEANLSGIGDNLQGYYLNTTGSNDWDVSYTLPVNPYNGTLKLDYRHFYGVVIEPPFDSLNLKSKYEDYKITFRQPIQQTPENEFALGIVFDHQTSANLIGDIPLPTYGSDLDGNFRLFTLRLFQDGVFRNAQEVIAARSEFSIGINGLGATQPFEAAFNPNAPQMNYFIWRGGLQWVRLLAPDTLLVAQTSLQLANGPLVPLEQFAIGGLGSVVGYPQNYLSTDNGIFASIEVRLPILRLNENNTLLQLVPFVDVGSGWNADGRSTIVSNTLTSVGLGLLLQQGSNFNARIDWGIGLTYVPIFGNSLNANGVIFSVNWKAF